MKPDLATVGAFILWAAGCPGDVLAQVPRGHFVISTWANPAGPASGLEIGHSLTPSVTTPVTGLPPELTGAGLPAPAGAGSVLVDEMVGTIVVGEHAQAGASLDLHFVTIAGTPPVATSIVSYPLGNLGSFGSTDQMAWVGSDVLVLNRGSGVVSGAMAGRTLGLVRPSIGPPGAFGTVVPLPLTSPLAGTVNALVVDAGQANAYVATFAFSGMATSWIYRIPLTAPHTPVLVRSMPGAVVSLASDTDGYLVVALAQGTGAFDLVHLVDPANGGTVVSYGSTWQFAPNGVAVDRATGDLLFAAPSTQVAFRLPRLGVGAYGAPTSMAFGIVGLPTGIALRPAVTTYGPGTPGAFTYAWSTTLLPGGSPALGNGGFQLAMIPNASTAPTVLGMSAGLPTPPPLTMFGFTLLLDPATLALPAAFATPPLTIPLAIPGNPALAGQDFFFQSLHLEPAGFAASNGLWVTPF